MSESVIFALIDLLVNFATDWLLPVMAVVFGVAMFLRVLIYFTIYSEAMFTKEFEKRVHLYLAGENRDKLGGEFHQLTEGMLNKTYYEIFELKQKFRRRKFDNITSFTDRVFLIQEGAARLVRDTLSQTKYLNKTYAAPKFINISKFVFGSNPVFNRVLGIMPMSLFNDVLSILPGLFVIGGIFGTFLGVMKALPELSAMDVSNVAGTKEVMDAFLLRISFSMSTSIVGILFSVAMTVANAIFSVEDLYIGLVNRYTSSLEFLWNDADDRRKFKDLNSMAISDRRNFRLNVGNFQDAQAASGSVAAASSENFQMGSSAEGMRNSSSFPGAAPRKGGGVVDVNTKKEVTKEKLDTSKIAKKAESTKLGKKEVSKASEKTSKDAYPGPQIPEPVILESKPTATASKPEWAGAVDKKADQDKKPADAKLSAKNVIETGNVKALEMEINKIYQQRKDGELTKEEWLKQHEKLTEEKETLQRKQAEKKNVA